MDSTDGDWRNGNWPKGDRSSGDYSSGDWPSGSRTSAEQTNLDQDGTLWETDTPTGTVSVLREIYGADFETARESLCRRFRRFLNRGELEDASFLYATLRLCDEPTNSPIAESAPATNAAAGPPSTLETSPDEGTHRALPVTPWQSMSCLG